MNTFTALETWFARASLSVSNAGEEAAAAKARADKAEQGSQEAERRAATESERAQVAEKRANAALAMICDLEECISSLREEVQLRDNKIAEAEKRASEIEAEIEEAKKGATEAEATTAEFEKKAVEAGVKVAEMERKVAEAEAKAVEAEKKTAEAEARAAETERKVAEAVDSFRQSPSFEAEITKGTAYAFNLGFRECKRKMKEAFNVEGVDDIEPDVPEGVSLSSEEETLPREM